MVTSLNEPGVPAQLSFRTLELHYQAALRNTHLGAWLRTGDLCVSLLNEFSDSGLLPSDIRIDNSGPSPADFVVTIYLFNFTVVARFRVDSIELSSKNSRATDDAEVGTALVVAATAAMRNVTRDMIVAGQTITLAAHFDLPHDTIDALLARFHVGPVPGTPPLVPMSVGFTSDVSAATRLVVELQRSLAYPESNVGFLRVVSSFAEGTNEKAACQAASSTLGDLVRRLGLESGS